MGKKIFKWLIYAAALAVIVSVALFALKKYRDPVKEEMFVSGNGRIEAQEVDIAAKLPGRILEILAKEGDTVSRGEVLVKLDISELSAKLQQTKAQEEQAAQNKNYALAVVAQRASELELAKKNLERSKELYINNDVSLAQLQQHEAAAGTMRAALAAAKAQVVSSEGAISAAKAQTQTIQANIDDCVLRSPINGRVLYRLLEPGEVIGAGGKALTLIEADNIYMTVFIPTANVGRIKIGDEARIKLDSPSNSVVPALVSFVSPDAQFTPKEIETKNEREKLMFRVKVKIDPEFLKTSPGKINSGVPAEAYLRLDSAAPWPMKLNIGASEPTKQ